MNPTTMTTTTTLGAREVPTMPEAAESEQDDRDDTEERIRAFLSGEHRRVVATVSLWSASPEDALDAVTNATGRVWEHLVRGEHIDNLAAWVTRVAMNEVRSGHRRRATARRKQHLIAVEDHHDDTTAVSAAHIDLRRALAQLTDRQRTVVALHHGLDRSIDEIAADLGIAPGTVKSTLHATRTRLAELLDAPDTGDLR